MTLKLSPILELIAPDYVGFYCPGCKETHAVRIGVENGERPRWGYNGNPAAPTFTPSILIRSGHYVPGQEGKRCWCDYNREHPEEAEDGFACSICHSYVTDGQIQFLADSTHALAGQTVPLPELPE